MSESEESKVTTPDAGSSNKTATEVTPGGGGEDVGSPPESEASSSASSPAIKPKNKVDILLKATGDAPIMKKKKWVIDQNKKIGWVMEFIKKYLKAPPEESMFIYVNQSFSPAPDTEIGMLYDCFGADGKLILHYCKTQAWG